jgi:hypothetical protein
VGGGVHTGSIRHVGHFWYITPASGDCEAGEFGGIEIGRGNRSTRTKPAPAPLGPPQIPLGQARARTRAAAVESQRLTAWAMTRPGYYLTKGGKCCTSHLFVHIWTVEITFWMSSNQNKKQLPWQTYLLPIRLYSTVVHVSVWSFHQALSVKI